MGTETQLALDLAERGWVPEPILRAGIRRLVASRRREISVGCEQSTRFSDAFVAEMDASDIAPLPHLANEQHYELPPEFFSLVLGKHRKYSACWWPTGVELLDDAEATSLRVTCERAGIVDGTRILELGCGWGSLTLWMAGHYPLARITAVSNSNSQREYVLTEAKNRGLDNIEVITEDMNQFQPSGQFDRVVSVEMFEHMRNYRELFHRVHNWLVPGGRFFMHIFCHRTTPYAFEVRSSSDWMSKHFFSGGIMPSDELPLWFQDHLRCINRWRWNGRHYERTANAWLSNMGQNRREIQELFSGTYGPDEAQRWWMRWRMFFAACAELFAYNNGEEWWVSHYLFERPDTAT